jgi:myosin heavy subunit
VTLLEEYPEAIEMVDYKGRLPSMLMPKHSMSYADTIAEAFIRGPSQYYWSARVSCADRTRTQNEVAARIKQLEEANQQQIKMSERLLDETQHQLTEEIEALSIQNVQLKERTAFYEAKFDGAEEKERVLVDHTNSLAERLRLTSLSEEHLATKLAKLEANLKMKETELEQLQTKSQEEKAAMQKQMENMASDLAEVELKANQLTISLAKKNDECDQMEKKFQKERELFEKQVEASKECLLELIASSKEDKKAFEQDSKDLRQQLISMQAELQKANQTPINLERQLENRLMDILNAQSVNKEQQRDHRQQTQTPASPRKYTHQRQQAQTSASSRKCSHQRQQEEKSVSPKKYTHKTELSLDDFDEYITETYKVQSRDDDDIVSIDSDIDTADLGDLSPEQQEALRNLDLSGGSAEVAKALKKVPGLTDNQVTLLLQVASSLAT